MKNRYSRLLTMLLIFTAIGDLPAQESPRPPIVLRAAIPRDFPPYYLIDEAGQPSGFAIEVMNLIADRAGFAISYVVKEHWADVNKATKRFSVEYAPGIPPVWGNVQRLEQVVINLIQNACQALPSTDRGIFVTSVYNQETCCAEIRIRDEGVGIPPEKLSRIQDPFFTTKREKGGTGLGLSISATIVKEHNGALNFLSKPGRGTTVTVVIPVIGEDVTKEAAL